MNSIKEGFFVYIMVKSGSNVSGPNWCFRLSISHSHFIIFIFSYFIHLYFNQSTILTIRQPSCPKRHEKCFTLVFGWIKKQKQR